MPRFALPFVVYFLLSGCAIYSADDLAVANSCKERARFCREECGRGSPYGGPVDARSRCDLRCPAPRDDFCG